MLIKMSNMLVERANTFKVKKKKIYFRSDISLNRLCEYTYDTLIYWKYFLIHGL